MTEHVVTARFRVKLKPAVHGVDVVAAGPTGEAVLGSVMQRIEGSRTVTRAVRADGALWHDPDESVSQERLILWFLSGVEKQAESVQVHQLGREAG